METTQNPVLDLSLDFALKIIDFCELLDSERRWIISRQLLKSGTSIGANVFEAQSPESKADFIHKLKIADKEANETSYWLTLCQRSAVLPYEESLMFQLTSIQKLLSTIIGNSKQSQ